MNDGQFYSQQPNRPNNFVPRQQPTPQYVYSTNNTPNNGFNNNMQPNGIYVNPQPYIQQPQPDFSGISFNNISQQNPVVLFFKDYNTIDEYLVGRGNGVIFIKEDWTEMCLKSVDTFGKPTFKWYSLEEHDSSISKEEKRNPELDLSSFVTWDELNKLLPTLNQPKQNSLGRKKVEDE